MSMVQLITIEKAAEGALSSCREIEMLYDRLPREQREDMCLDVQVIAARNMIDSVLEKVQSRMHRMKQRSYTEKGGA